MRAFKYGASAGVIAGLLAGTMLAGSAQAQDSGDIVVTARKVEENLQDIPIAITAATGEALEAKGVQSLSNLGSAVPGLQTRTHPSNPSIVVFNLRGQGAGDTLLTVDQAVGVYLDNVYVARPRGLSGAFFDVQRVEVLKGPQGTLYGRNTTGGAVTIYTKNADFEGMHGFVQGELGNHDMRSIAGAVNIPLIEDKLAVRVAGKGLWRDGFGRSVITGQDLGADRNQLIGRLSVLAQPTDSIRMNLKAEHYRSRENNSFWRPAWVNPFGPTSIQAGVEEGGTFLGPASFAPTSAYYPFYQQGQAVMQGIAAQTFKDWNTNYTQELQQDDNDVTTLGATIDIDLTDDIFLKSVTGYRTLKSWQAFDLDGTPYMGLDVGVGANSIIPISDGGPGTLSSNFTIDIPPEQDANFFSQEFNLGGSAFAGRADWLLGAYYSRERGRDYQSSRVFPSLAPLLPVNDGLKIKSDSWSLFGQVNVKVTDALSVTGGLRYTEETKGLLSQQVTFFPSTGLYDCRAVVVDADNNPATPAVPLAGLTDPTACQIDREDTFTGWSYLASVNYQISDDVLVYARTGKGFRGGAQQLRAPAFAPAGPETVVDYEIGLKGDFLDGLLRANIAAFQSNYTNKQESTIITTDQGLITVFQNAADAKIRGFEGEFTVRPVHGLTLGANVAYLWGKYGSYTNALPADSRTNPDGTPVVIDASGERFSNPPWTVNLTGRYEAEVTGGMIGVQADWSWTDGANPPARLINQALFNSPGGEAIINKTVAAGSAGNYQNGRKSTNFLNVRADFTISDYDLKISLWSTNLLNKRYGISGIDPNSTGVLAVLITEPRMVGITLRKGFGGE